MQGEGKGISIPICLDVDIQCGCFVCSSFGLSQQSQWVLPGHGDPKRFESPEITKVELDRCMHWMEQQPKGYHPSCSVKAATQAITSKEVISS